VQDLAGRRVGNYDIKERLGAGGMAVVYRAVQQPLNREVALKMLVPALVQEPGFLQRFELEARTLARLDHPNILPIYDFGVAGEVVFITMPLIRGGTLRDVLDRGPLDGSTAWRYLREVGLGLQHAHDAGIVHRDLKPNNVLLHPDGRAVLADFGLARSVHEDIRLTSAGFALGTPGYMAPEQVLGQDLDRRVDIYAMGVMTFEMMTGRMPFVGTTPTEIAIATVTQAVPSACAINPMLPDELDAVLARAMAKSPADRPASVAELIGLLAKVPQRRSVAVGAVAAAQPAATPAPAAIPPSQTIPPSYEEAPPPGPTITLLEQLGLPRLTPTGTTVAGWYFEAAVHSARETAGPKWIGIAKPSGLADFIDSDPPVDRPFTGGVEVLSSVTTVFEAVFAADAAVRLRDWGRRTTERALARRPTAAREQSAIRLVPGRRRVGILLKGYLESLDEMRGEHAHAFRELDSTRFWSAHYRNPFARGRRRAEKSCHYWIACYEGMLRWAGLANDWLVDEVECGCVTGTGDCVFAIRAVKS
jgi:hypothetical protein